MQITGPWAYRVSDLPVGRSWFLTSQRGKIRWRKRLKTHEMWFSTKTHERKHMKRGFQRQFVG